MTMLPMIDEEMRAQYARAANAQPDRSEEELLAEEGEGMDLQLKRGFGS